MIKVSQIWENIMIEVEGEVSALTFDLWIKTLNPICIYKDRLVLLAETEALKNIVEKRYHEMLKKSTRKVFSTLVDVEIITPDMLTFFEQYQEYEMPEKTQHTESVIDEPTSFVAAYTFDNWVKGESNKFATAAAMAVAEKPGSKYNPLFLYGGVGLGKTHLMHAIGNYLKKYSPKTKTVYASAERFTSELIDSIRGGGDKDSRKEFRKRYRQVDVLMLDDIQFLARTAETQEEVFNTFNDLYLAGKQIIICSDRPPKEINPLQERLRTRFESGLLADIGTPDLEMRIAILQRMCMMENAHIDREILQVVAERLTSNVRELKGFVTRITTYATLIGCDPNDMEVALGILKDFADDQQETITMEKIVDNVCKYFNIDQKELIGKKKNKEIVVPRQICIYLITEFLAVPLVSIGNFFGGRDHTTIMHARDKISEQIKENTNVAAQVKDLKDAILKR